MLRGAWILLQTSASLYNLNGISFHQGFYIGQKLTARTYHTWVVRKRILPIEILEFLPGVF